MLRGVNRQVVDVTETDSAYFERVIFFVKPEYCGMGENTLRRKADALLKNSTASHPVKTRKSRREKLLGALKLLGAALSGAVAAITMFSAFI